jgi:hypothetical protein
MSHHLDSPQARQDVRLDVTDVYVFRGEVGTVFVMNLNNSIAGADAPKGFHPEARYEFRIDTNGDAVEDLVYRLTFEPRNDEGSQLLALRRLTGVEAREPANPGTLLLAGTTEHMIGDADGLRLWAGLASDPFYIDLTVLKAVGAAFEHGTAVDLAGWNPATAANLFAGTTVQSIVLEVPDADFDGLLGPDRQIGVWGMSILATDAGGWRPINRAGLPMIQPIFNQEDGHRADHYNTSSPSEDRDRYGALFAGMVASVVAAQGTADDPAAYGAAVADLMLPDVLPYRIGSQASYTFLARNGRTLTDNAAEIMCSLATNSALSIGITRRNATAAPRDRFPYLAAPVQTAKPAVTAPVGTAEPAITA